MIYDIADLVMLRFAARYARLFDAPQYEATPLSLRYEAPGIRLAAWKNGRMRVFPLVIALAQ
jgi:hypothetical protein